MIEKVATIRKLGDRSAEQEEIAYWLSRPSGERMEAIEALRRQFYGPIPGIQRVARVFQRETR